MEIWMKQGKRKFRVPVLPASYQIKTAQINTTVMIHGLGEVNLLGKRGLKEISFSSFFPKTDQSYCEYRRIKKPKEYVELIEKMKKKGTVKLHITGILSMSVSIEEFEYGEDDGTGDITYTISLKEYRHLSIPTSVLEQTAESADAGRETPQPEAGKTHEVQDGECLTSIARKETGSTNWKPIYEANKEQIGSNPNKIQVGQVLIIP